jgi:hypothetical protein
MKVIFPVIKSMRYIYTVNASDEPGTKSQEARNEKQEVRPQAELI